MHFKSISCSGLESGPKLIVTGAVHGNETCGTRAIQRIVHDIDAGTLPIVKGRVTFVPITNPLAYARGERMGDRNLNRNLAPTNAPRDFEDHVANWLCPLLEEHEALLDLHSTRAATKPFAMLGPRDNSGPIEPFLHQKQERGLARRLGVKRFVEGWLDTYAKGVERRVRDGTARGLNTSPSYGVGTTEFMRSTGGYAITLECGQHEDPLAVEVAYRAIRNALAFLGISAEAEPGAVKEYEALRLCEVIDRKHPDDRFEREWSSFDAVKEGDLIATRHDGERVAAPRDGWIVFPDHKALPGNEWFYLAEPVAEI